MMATRRLCRYATRIALCGNDNDNVVGDDNNKNDDVKASKNSLKPR